MADLNKMLARSLFRAILFASVTLLFTPTLSLAQSCDCDVSDSKETAYDALLNLDADEKAEAIATHLPWGIPTGPTDATNEHLLHQREYIINYDDDLRVPIWVAYRLREFDLRTHRERTECFRRDKRLSADAAAVCDDYEEPIYDRGHMCPNADMVRSEAAMINTYMFSNMCPQHDKFNRVIWKRLEGYVRDWAKLKDEVYVITGAVFDKDCDGQRDDDDDANLMAPTDRVAVPTHFYKIILHERPNGFIESLTILLPHEDVSRKGRTANTFLKNHIVTIDDIEALTGIDFLTDPAMNDNKEKAIESSKASKLWPRR